MYQHTEEQLAREIELENRAHQISKDRLQENLKRTGLAETQGGKSLIERSLKDYIKRLSEWHAAEDAKRNKSAASKYLEVLSNEQVSFIVARAIVNAMTKAPVLYDALISDIADHVIQAVCAELHNEKDPERFERFTRRMDWQSRTFVRQRMAKEEFRQEYIEVNPGKDAVALGAVLVELFIEATDLCEADCISRYGGTHTVRVLRLTDKGRDWLLAALEDNEVAEPFNLPMIIPPFAWTTLDDGGYVLRNPKKNRLIRTRGRHSQPLLEAADLSRVMEAVNAIQSTPWRINQRVYEVWKQLVGTGQAGCSAQERIDIPEAVPEDHPEFEAVRGRRREALEALSKNNAMVSSEAQKARLAEILKDEPEFYFPHNLDFRGRVYPMAGVGSINPQGDDSGKALLEFAEGKPLGEDGLQWLYIHTQNCWGNDKVSLQERIDATDHNLELYINNGQDPFVYTDWMEADKPFCFLACCFELQLLHTWVSVQGQPPETFDSFLPIALDGSCSGLQHFSALMLDEDLAEAVNVKPALGDLPADVYSEVARIVAENTAEDAALGSLEAIYWAAEDKITRDLIKQPVMTLAYGVTKSGMRSQIREKCKKLVRKGQEDYLEGSREGKPKYLADCVHDAIEELSDSAFLVMDWLSRLAKARVEAYPDSLLGALSWTTPVGLPVLQEYYEYETERINVFVDGRRLRFTRRVGDGAVVKKSKQAQSAAPNFIHSLDAAHLMLTVNACAGHGVDSFAMIHDSFGTHAADTGILFEVLRDEFRKMYEPDWLWELYSEQADVVDIEPPPQRRTLDLNDVMASDYFFA